MYWIHKSVILAKVYFQIVINALKLFVLNVQKIIIQKIIKVNYVNLTALIALIVRIAKLVNMDIIQIMVNMNFI